MVLSNSDLSRQLSQSLAALADVHKKARKLEEEQAQDDIILLMGTGTILSQTFTAPILPVLLFAVEEYIRLIGSIRVRIYIDFDWTRYSYQVDLAHVCFSNPPSHSLAKRKR